MKNELKGITLGAAKERHEAWKTAHAGFLTSPRSRWQSDFDLMFKINDLGTGACIYSYTISSIMKTQSGIIQKLCLQAKQASHGLNLPEAHAVLLARSALHEFVCHIQVKGVANFAGTPDPLGSGEGGS